MSVNSIRSIILRSAATAALVIGSTVAMAQAPGGGDHGGGAGGGGPGAAHGGGAAAPGGMSPGAGGADREAPGAGGEHGAGGPGAAKTGPGAERAAPAAEKAAPGAEKPQRAEGGQPAKEGRPGGNAPAAAGAAGHGGHANLSGDQRTKFKGAIRSHHVEAIHGADFAVRAGTIIPDHYHFYPLPPELIEIVPEYEGYDYILVDNEIIILEPGTRRIVDIIED